MFLYKQVHLDYKEIRTSLQNIYGLG